MIDCENVWTPLLDAQMALSKLHLCALVWEAWTDFGSVGAGRRAVLGRSDKISEGLSHPRWTPPFTNRVFFTRRSRFIFDRFYLFVYAQYLVR